MTAAGLNYLNYIGALRKNKNATIQEDPSIDVTPFEFDRFKRHLTGLLERVSRMSMGDDASQKPEAVEEEDDIESNAKKDEESDWVLDVEKTIEVLPRLLDTNDNKASTSNTN